MHTIKKYTAEIMGIYFSVIFFLLGITATMISPVEGIITIPPSISIPVFVALLSGLIILYLKSIFFVKSWRKAAELFVMLAAICSSLSDGFWIFLFIASLIINIGSLIEKKTAYKNPLFILWFLLLCSTLISSINAVDSKFLSYGAVFGLFIYAGYFLAVYQQNFYQERGTDFLQNIAVLMSFSIVSTVIFSLWHYFFPYFINVLIFQFQAQTGYGDSFGMASIYGQWPTHSSSFLSLAFWLLIGIFVSQKNQLPKHRKIIILVGIIFSFVGAMATLSRNAFLFLVLSVGIAFLLILIQEKNRKYLWGILGAGAVFSGILLFFLTHFSKWADLLKNPLQQATIAERIAQYQFGWEQFIAYPNKLFGIGLMNFGPFYRRIQNNPNLADYLHQLFLSLMLEMGIIGLILFLILLIMIGIRIVKNYRQNSIYFVPMVVFFAWLSTGIFDNWLYFLWSSTLFMIIIAWGSKPQEQAQ